MDLARVPIAAEPLLAEGNELLGGGSRARAQFDESDDLLTVCRIGIA